MPVRTAVIPAAGLGTRFLPATKVVPKELLPVFDTPSLQHTVDEAIGAGIDHIILVSNRAKPAIEAFADKASGGARITVVYQDAPRGLGHAVGIGHVHGQGARAGVLGHKPVQGRGFAR